MWFIYTRQYINLSKFLNLLFTYNNIQHLVRFHLRKHNPSLFACNKAVLFISRIAVVITRRASSPVKITWKLVWVFSGQTSGTVTDVTALAIVHTVPDSFNESFHREVR